MTIAKVPEEIARLVSELRDQDKDPREIARLVNLKPVQVSAILASFGFRASKSETMSLEADFADVKSAENADESVARVVEATEAQEPREGFQAGEEEEPTGSPDKIYVGDDLEFGDPIFWEPMHAQA